jgi:hypothetical protein
MLLARMISLANALSASSWAALAEGPNALIPTASNASTAFGADDGQADIGTLGKCDQGLDIGVGNIYIFTILSGAGVAGGAVEFGELFRL